MTQRLSVFFLALAALTALPKILPAGPSWGGRKEQESISWSLTAAGRCTKTDTLGRWLDGTCVQLVTKVAGGLIKAYVPDSDIMVKALLETFRCERGKGSAGGVAPFLASCVDRQGEEAAQGFAKWKELRAKAPDVPSEVPDAPMPKGDSLFK